MAESLPARLRRLANRMLHPLGLHLVRSERAFEMDLALGLAARRGMRIGTWIDVGASLQVFSGRDGSAALRGPGGTRDVSDPGLASTISRSARVLAGEDSPAWVRLPLTTEAAK